MKINELKYGFRLKEVEEIAEIGAEMQIMEHEKSGAKLCFLKRDDECKTFAIAFRTIPEDSTGVFHILEHSVLDGSRKYPIKEPFTELLKGSLNSFLNAMTYNDKTAYPVSSRNDKDFSNLISVYLDATLHPNVLQNEFIFRQEGWRLEVGEDGKDRINGVVYNEMKGASTVDEYIDNLNNELLYPESCYSHSSGGKPEDIPNLSYEQFKEAHAKFYHPSNSYIFLDGSVNLDDTLPLIDSYLCEFDRKEVTVNMKLDKPANTEHIVTEYEVENADNLENKGRTILSYPLFDHSEKEKSIALSIIKDAICDTNSSPLKSEVLKHNLCENFFILPDTNLKKVSVSVDFYGVKDGKEDELISVFKNALKKIVDEKIDKELLLASLNSFEFRTREGDYGSYPKGIVYMSAVFEDWLYDEKPQDALRFDKTFKFLREKIDTDYYDRLLEEVFFKSDEVFFTLNPSTTLAKRRQEKEEKRIADIFANMSAEEKKQLKDFQEKFELWQKTPDTIDDINKLPKLEISDINPKIQHAPIDVKKVKGATSIFHKIENGGITYLSMFFDISDMPISSLPYVSLISFLSNEVDTANYSASKFNSLVKTHFGVLDCNITPLTKDKKAKLYFTVNASLLDTERENCLPLIREFLYNSKYDNIEKIKQIIIQLSTDDEQSLTEAGLNIALSRVGAQYSPASYLSEIKSGYSFHNWLKNAKADIDNEAKKVADAIAELIDKALTKERLTLSVTSAKLDTLDEQLIKIVKDGDSSCDVYIEKTLPKRNEAIVVPAMINYAVTGNSLFNFEDEKFCGSMVTLRTVLNYSILWNEIRVSGGAYGAGEILRKNSGLLGFYSYRDPNPKNSLKVYRELGEKILLTVTDKDFDLTKSIIGAVRDLTPLRTPRSMGNSSTIDYLSGVREEEIEEMIEQAMSADIDELKRLAKTVQKVMESSTFCIVGNRDKIKEVKGIDAILEI